MDRTKKTKPRRRIVVGSKVAAGTRVLHEHHRKMLVEDSAIAPEVVEERGCYTVTTKSELGRKGFGRSQQGVPGLMFPIHGPTGEQPFGLYRPDDPRVLDGKKRKYEFPAKQKMALDVPPRCRAHIGDPGVPLFITEGSKKADAGATRGLCLLALLGVWNWRGRNGLGGKTALPEWEYVALKGRKVYVVFDSDVMQKIEVYGALERLRGFLKHRGADVRVIYLSSGPGGTKVGLDDFFAMGNSVDDLLACAQEELRRPPSRIGQREHTRLVDAVEGIPASEELVVPPGYELSSGGILEVKLDGRTGEERSTTVSSAPIVITGRMSDVNEEQESVELLFLRAGRWRRHVVNRAVVCSAREIVSLADRGVAVNSGNASNMVRYLSEFEAANIAGLPHTRTSARMGWQGRDGGFLWGRQFLVAGRPISETPLDVEALPPEERSEDLIVFKGHDEGDEQIASGFHAAGSMEGWQETVKPLAPYPRATLAIYCSLAAPLLAILKASNFVIDFSYVTSRGKTIILRVAASCWGNPDERAPDAVLGTWDATRVWIERASSTLNSLPLHLDDTKRARRPQDIGQVLYDVASGRGRGRGTRQGVGRTGSWSTVLLSTGEQPVTTFTEDGGTRARVLPIWGSPFERTDEATARLANDLNLGVKEHYGHAGPRLVQYLIDNPDEWTLWRNVHRGKQRDYLEAAGGDPVLGRMADYFATLYVTALVAEEAQILPWRADDPVASVWEGLATEASEADRAKNMLEMVVSWASLNEHAFRGREWNNNLNKPVPPPAGYAGKWDSGDGWSCIAFYPHKLKTLLKNQEHDPEAILRTWRDRGWLSTKGDRKRYTKELRDGKDKKTHFVVIRREAIDGLSADGDGGT